MKYRDVKERTIINGTTTIVTGVAQVNADVHTKATEKLLKAIDILMTNTSAVTKGVAKVHPDDVYEKTTGLKVASKKAELKGRTALYNKYVDVINLIGEVSDLLEGELDKCGARMDALATQLSEELTKTEPKAEA